MTQMLIRHARILTMGGKPGPQRGSGLGTLGVIEDGWVRIGERQIEELGSEARGAPHRGSGETEIDAKGRVVMPGFVDCHTHACWAGDRLDEWDQKRAGVPYLEILKRGGGIMSTVRAVRDAAPSVLRDSLRHRINMMRAEGTTTIEVKTGYGLTPNDELKMFMVISHLDLLDGVVPTALLGHAINPDVPRDWFITLMADQALDLVHRIGPGTCIDAFCESGAWTLDECIRLFTRAKHLGHPFRVHADQFNAMGMTEWAVDHGAISVDHLEASTESGLQKLAASDAFGVMLPACGFHLDGRYAKGRAFVDMGGALAIATNLNPGSAPCFSMPFIIALGVRHLGLTPQEAIAAATINPASLLGLSDRGYIAPGARADLIILRHTDERNLAFEFGGNHIHEVIHAGTPLFQMGLLDR